MNRDSIGYWPPSGPPGPPGPPGPTGRLTGWYGLNGPFGGCWGSAPGRGEVTGPGCAAVPGAAIGGAPGNWLVTGLAGCACGTETVIGSSTSSTGMGARWNGGGGAMAALAAGARLVARIVMRS